MMEILTCRIETYTYSVTMQQNYVVLKHELPQPLLFSSKLISHLRHWRLWIIQFRDFANTDENSCRTKWPINRNFFENYIDCFYSMFWSTVDWCTRSILCDSILNERYFGTFCHTLAPTMHIPCLKFRYELAFD